MEEAPQSKIEDELMRDLARLSFSSAAIYPILFIIVYVSTSIDFSALALCGFFAVFPAGIARISTARSMLASEHPSRGRLPVHMGISVVVAALGWCVFSGATIQVEGAKNWNSMFLLLISTGLAAGGASSLAGGLRLGRLFIFVLWFTHASVYLSLSDWPTAFVITLFCFYLAVQHKRQHQRLVNSIVDRERIAMRAEELKRAHGEAKFAQETAERALILAEQARETAELANKAKTSFLATVSHEIRTPLHGVLGMNTLLLDSPLNEEQREYAATIKNSGEALLELINDVLGFSKLEAGREELREEDFCLEDLLTQCRETVSHRASEKELSLDVSIDETIPSELRGDPSHLRQVLLNLLSNAVKFTDQGGVRVDARLLKKETERYWVEIRVSDTGIGISREGLELLFQPFRQLNSSTTRTRGGTGLGLAISRRLVGMMGGVVEVESEPEEGSTFRLELPFKPATGSIVQSADEGRTHLNKREAVAQKILVVEDNLTNQKILQRLLQKAGYQCDVVDNGLRAIEAVVKHPYGLVLMDCHMPEMDGYQATQEIRKNLGEEAPPVVAVTANASEQDRNLCRQSGMVDFLTKPVKLGLLQKILDTYLVD